MENITLHQLKYNQIKKLVEMLRKRDVISDGEVKEIMSMELFAQLFV